MSAEADFAAAGQALREMMLAAEALRTSVARQAELGNSDASAIAALSRAPSLTPRQLADRLRMSTPNITALIDRLERGGMVVRSPHPTDRRSVLVSLTDKSRAQVRLVRDELDRILLGMPNLRFVTRTLNEVARRVNLAAEEPQRFVVGDPREERTAVAAGRVKVDGGSTLTDIAAAPVEPGSC